VYEDKLRREIFFSYFGNVRKIRHGLMMMKLTRRSQTNETCLACQESETEASRISSLGSGRGAESAILFPTRPASAQRDPASTNQVLGYKSRTIHFHSTLQQAAAVVVDRSSSRSPISPSTHQPAPGLSYIPQSLFIPLISSCECDG